MTNKSIKFVNCEETFLEKFKPFIEWFEKNIKDNIHTRPKTIYAVQEGRCLTLHVDEFNHIMLNDFTKTEIVFYKAVDRSTNVLMGLGYSNEILLDEKLNIVFVPIFGCNQNEDDLNSLLKVLKYHGLIIKNH